MPIIKNALWSPLTVEVAEGKLILLDPRGAKSVTDAEFQSDGCQKLIRDGNLYPLPDASAGR